MIEWNKLSDEEKAAIVAEDEAHQAEQERRAEAGPQGYSDPQAGRIWDYYDEYGVPPPGGWQGN